MRNVLAIFKGDLKALMTNMIAAVVAMGLIIVPPMYAWLTTLGFWNPYANTGNISVVVANEDEGYQSALLSSRLDAGSQIVSTLHENDQFDWKFENREKAIESVKSGESYAAFVIPENFSKDMMTAFSSEGERPTIEYYTNQKVNAIATHVTSEGADDLEAKIDESFTDTVAKIALDATEDVSNFLSGDGIYEFAKVLSSQLNDTIDQLDASITQAKSFSDLIGIADDLMKASQSILSDTGTITNDTNAILGESQNGLDSAASALDGASNDINAALGQASSSYTTIETAVNEAFNAFGAIPSDSTSVLNNLSKDVSSSISSYRALKSTLTNLGASSAVISDLDSAISALQELNTSLKNAKTGISNTSSDIENAKKSIQDSLSSAKLSIGNVSSALESDLKTQATALDNDLNSVREDAKKIGSVLSSTSTSMSQTASGLMDSLDSINGSIDHTVKTLEDARKQLDETRTKLNEALDSNDLNEIRKIIGNDPSSVASFISSPTELVEHKIFEMQTNGDSMSSFYSSLSLWIGAIFLVALTMVNVPKRRLEDLNDPKPWQLYIGRYGIFSVIALLQAIVLFIGNIFLVGIQCEHIWLYLLACCVCAIVFSNIVYTLTISFGNIGKAIAIIMLVMQLAGTGGIMPVQMSAPIFQEIYPWLPFSHSIDALSGCIAGIYGDQYLVSILFLLVFLAASLTLGLIFRRPLIRLNTFINAKLEETKFL